MYHWVEMIAVWDLACRHRVMQVARRRLVQLFTGHRSGLRQQEERQSSVNDTIIGYWLLYLYKFQKKVEPRVPSLSTP